MALIRAGLPDPNSAGPPDKWYVVQNKPSLQGSDIVDPEQNFDNGPGRSGQPIVVFDFTRHGAAAWEAVTRRIARRGQDGQIPGADPLASAQHFAIVLDDALISVPYIDFQQNPDGIDASNGSQIQGGFTVDSARNLAVILNAGALPVALHPAEVKVTP